MIIRQNEFTPATEGKKVGLLVGSLVFGAVGKGAERLIWIRVSNDPISGLESLEVLIECMASRMPEWLDGNMLPKRIRNASKVENRGFFPTGERYVVYRLALYADEFKKHNPLSDTKRVCGVYMIFLGLPIDERRFSSCAQVFCVDAQGQKENCALNIVEEDLVKGTTKGVLGFDL